MLVQNNSQKRNPLRNWVLAFLSVFILVALAGCTDIKNSDPSVETRTSVAGIHLGDTPEDVISSLGNDYEQEAIDEMVYTNEGVYLWKYNKGIEVTIGRDSQKVLSVISHSPEFQTNLGVAVGDTAGFVNERYNTRFNRFVSPQTNSILDGWFEVEDAGLLIFDFNEENMAWVNDEFQNDSKVEVINLSYIYLFD